MAGRWVKRWVVRARRRLSRSSPRRILAAGALAALALGGLAWLILASGTQYVPLTEPALSPGELAAAQQVLRSRGIDCQVRSGRLVVDRRQCRQARELLKTALAAAKPSPSDSSADDSLWQSEAQQAKRWLGVKTAALVKAIEAMPGIDSATVLLEPGEPRRLGSPAIEPSAAVNVTLAPGGSLNPRLVEAIADLVSGSMSGMSRSGVRVVDNTGRSWHAGPTVTGDEHFDRVRAAEAYYADKVRAALRYVDDPIVSVRVSGTGGVWRCEALSVLVPRSYLASVTGSSAPRGAGHSNQPDPAFVDELARLAQTVAGVIGQNPAPAISVDSYCQSPGQEASPAAQSAGEADQADSSPAATVAIAMAVAVAGAGAWLALRRRRLAKTHGEEPSPPTEAFAFLQRTLSDELLAFMQNEHPQTIALVLVHLPPSKAAAVLASLAPQRQAEVALRVAEMEKIDPAAVREVERELAERLAHMSLAMDGRLGGPEALARVLQYAPEAAERNVLRSLADQQPQLAGDVRKHMFRFEDVVHLPAYRLHDALRDADVEELAIALHAAPPEVREKVLSSLDPSALAELKDEMARVGPVRLSDVESAQEHVAELLRASQEGQYRSAHTEVTNELTA